MNLDHDYLKQLLKSGPPDINLENFKFLPTVKYQQRIHTVCNKIKNVCNTDYYACCIYLNNNEKLLLSNNVAGAAPYLIYGFDRGDTYWHTDKVKTGIDHDFPSLEEGDPIQALIRTIMTEHYHSYHIYRAIRDDGDLALLFACVDRNPIENPQNFYHETIDALEDFTVDFFDQLIEICTEELPLLKLTRFATDKNYRKTFIKNRDQANPSKLYPRELECLFWASRGKSIEETAAILNLAPNTIDSYRKTAIKKLNASNIVHAVFLALQQRLLI